ncbi:hypothetical protein D1AOALGA4SA_691 [Olavius algarvensis Delta 1 endosymbiont]|nr:hypothetical protein D1AOALGA4SA_691 [Olavius algarvensis Delta 1 endosymbiont]
MEKWNIGNRRRMTVWFYKLIRAIAIKINPIQLNPVLRRRIFDIQTFQYSIIPLPSTAGFMAEPIVSAWPRERGFLRQKQFLLTKV